MRTDVNNDDEMKIAGSKNISDWRRLKSRLELNEDGAWNEAWRDFFMERLDTRYLNPIRVLEEKSEYKGEGFSIVTIQCALIEFLEATYQGKSYRYVQNGSQLGENEYSQSRDMFESFLLNRKPFNSYFMNKSVAKDFYKNVRCGLMHEARTKKGWKIRVGKFGDPMVVISETEKIVYRRGLLSAIEEYIKSYEEELKQNKKLQTKFIRKFDSLCD